MGAQSRAHRAVTTRAQPAIDRAFEQFCKRQTSRVANTSHLNYRRYVTRVLKVVESETLDVTVSGYGIGGGGRHGRKDSE